jgi:hypothetical protein
MTPTPLVVGVITLETRFWGANSIALFTCFNCSKKRDDSQLHPSPETCLTVGGAAIII